VALDFLWFGLGFLAFSAAFAILAVVRWEARREFERRWKRRE
jgi:hypothetical protein